VVAERYVDEGETLAANAPLLRIVELDPIVAVFFVTERDYALLRTGQNATIATDAFPGVRFDGSIERIAPVFREATRQARVEVRVDNPDLHLKPGMFARATVVLDRLEQAVIVPQQALTTRDGGDGVFLVAPDGASVVWREVQPGIRQDGRVAIEGDLRDGLVVVLGQQLLDDGSAIRIAETRAPAAP
jgi:RND family efflux transporter MFP subunit